MRMEANMHISVRSFLGVLVLISQVSIASSGTDTVTGLHQSTGAVHLLLSTVSNSDVSAASNVAGEAAQDTKPPALPASDNLAKDDTTAVKTPKTTPSEDTHVHYGWFVDGTAAVFGILAVVFALFVLVIGFKGWSEFDKIMKQVDKQVLDKLDSSVEARVNDFVSKKLTPRLEASFREKQAETVKALDDSIANELDKAKGTLQSEVSRLLATDEVCRQVVDMAVFEVGRKLAPPAPPSKPDEFDPKTGGK